MMTMMKYRSLTTLISRLVKDNELPSSRGWVNKMIASGKIVLPKQKHANRYALTDEIIEQLVTDLKKKGTYDYTKA